MASASRNLMPLSFEIEVRESKEQLSENRFRPYFEISPVRDRESISESIPIGTIFTAAGLLFFAVMMLSLGGMKLIAHHDDRGATAFLIFGAAIFLPGVLLTYKAVQMIRQTLNERMHVVSFNPD
mmetsp:Transcript_27270/g.48997  ORF Transcript_27270/g.48997 Transcript_27270/m.48997 type:complete len:125 (-) Transcript_27270:18-392(-)